MKRSLILLLLATALLAFQKITREEVMQERLDEKVYNYRVLLEKKCRESVLDSASVLVDSILITQAKVRKDSSLIRPPKPDKPHQPDLLHPRDSSPIRPLFLEDSSFNPQDSGR